MSLNDVTAVVLTLNEEANILRCLEPLRRLHQVIVIDSGSTDATLDLCAQFDRVKVIERPFDDHSAQWNFGVDHAPTTWVLTLDADYVVNEEFLKEIENLDLSGPIRAWGAKFHYVIAGRRLRGTLYPPRLVLFDRGACRYEQDGHTQILKVQGPTAMLSTRLNHDDRKPLSRWLESQRKYALLEAEKLHAGVRVRGRADKLRVMIWPAAPAAFLYSLLAKRLILDGWPGFYYALQRCYAELLLGLLLLERKLRSRKPDAYFHFVGHRREIRIAAQRDSHHLK